MVILTYLHFWKKCISPYLGDDNILPDEIDEIKEDKLDTETNQECKGTHKYTEFPLPFEKRVFCQNNQNIYFKCLVFCFHQYVMKIIRYLVSIH